MSYRWHFHAYSHEAFEAMFRGGRGDLTETFIEMSTWDDYGDVVSRMTAMSEHVAAKGITYDGLSDAQANDLDQWVHFAFCPEGFVEELKIMDISPGDGLAHRFVHEIVEASRPRTKRRLFRKDEVYSGFEIGMFAILDGGRRYRQSEPAECQYVFLSPEDISAMVRDTILAIEHVEPCDAAIVLREGLVDVLSGLPAGTYVYGRLG